MIQFGERFQGYRKAKEMTQQDVASALNVSPQAISKWEGNISMPDISLLPEIAELFNITIDELLGRKEEVMAEILTEKKDINKMVLKIVVDDASDSKVRINIPVVIIKLCLQSGMALPSVNGNESLKSIDFEAIFALIEQGVVGNLIDVEDGNGTRFHIGVE